MSITISGYTGDSDGSALANYQFVLVPGTTNYHFYTPVTGLNPTGSLVTTDPTSFTNGEKFEFDLAVAGVNYHWEIKDYDLTSTAPGGKWKNNHKKPQIADDDDTEKGTFTAQSGLGEDAKTAGAS